MSKALSILADRVLILMIAERPEEISFMRQILGEKVLIIGSSFDENPERHLRLTDLIVNYCQRMVESNKNIVLFIDSLTRYIRAHNMTNQGNGKTLSGGLDSEALLAIKPILGSARNFKDHGSLSIFGTMLIETGSKMDEIIFDESKGTSNMDVILSQELAVKGYFPSINIAKSSTRKVENLVDEKELKALELLKRLLLSVNNEEGFRKLTQLIDQFQNNEDLIGKFLDSSF